MYIHIYIQYLNRYLDIYTFILKVRMRMLDSTANIHTYTPISYNTVYISLIRHCKHLLVVVYKSLSRMDYMCAGTPLMTSSSSPPGIPRMAPSG